MNKLNDNILEVSNLKKYFDNTKAVDDISFQVRRGSFFAFLGQNGAGKSTTIQCITTLLDKDEGYIVMDGNQDDSYIRNHVGVVFQENVLDSLLTVKENLLTRGAMFHKSKEELMKRYNELLVKLKLTEIEKQKFKTLSGGQKRRVEIARALFSNPTLLIMDEPTTGLDPETRRLVWEIIASLQKEEGITVFLTTHYMEEAAEADYVVIINKGKIVATGSPAELKAKYSDDFFKVVPKDKTSLVTYLDDRNLEYKKVSDQYIIPISDIEMAISLVVDLKDNIRWFEVVHGTLDDVFLEIVGDDDV